MLVQREHDVGSKRMSGNPRLSGHGSGAVTDTTALQSAGK